MTIERELQVLLIRFGLQKRERIARGGFNSSLSPPKGKSSRTDFRGCTFTNVSLLEFLPDLDIRYSDITKISDLNLCLESKKIEFRQVILDGANLSLLNLANIKLCQSYLVRTNLAFTDLRCANLSGANLTRANFEGADLRRANLSGANLTLTNLSYADLEGANIEGTNLTRANTTLTRGIL